MGNKKFNPENIGFHCVTKNMEWFLLVSEEPRVKVIVSNIGDCNEWVVLKFSRDPDDDIPDANYNGYIPDDDFARTLLINMGVPSAILHQDHKFWIF